MQDGGGSELPGKLVFYATLVGVIAFFWWLLIFDHGVTPTH